MGCINLENQRFGRLRSAASGVQPAHGMHGKGDRGGWGEAFEYARGRFAPPIRCGCTAGRGVFLLTHRNQIWDESYPLLKKKGFPFLHPRPLFVYSVEFREFGVGAGEGRYTSPPLLSFLFSVFLCDFRVFRVMKRPSKKIQYTKPKYIRRRFASPSR